MARPVKAKMIVHLFDGDVAKAAMVRTKIVGRAMVRRDASGRVIVDNDFRRDDGKPTGGQP